MTSIFKRLFIGMEAEAITIYLKSKGIPMSLIQQLIAAFTALETQGSATIGPETETFSANVFGQKITVSVSETATLTKA